MVPQLIFGRKRILETSHARSESARPWKIRDFHQNFMIFVFRNPFKVVGLCWYFVDLFYSTFRQEKDSAPPPAPQIVTLKVLLVLVKRFIEVRLNRSGKAPAFFEFFVSKKIMCLSTGERGTNSVPKRHNSEVRICPPFGKTHQFANDFLICGLPAL